MCSITICGKGDLADVLKKNKYDAILSINDPMSMKYREQWDQTLKRFSPNVMCLYFWDTNDQRMKDSPQMGHILAIKRFGKECANKKILVHCKFGISRSTAAAIIILQQVGLSYEQAFKHVLTIRPIAQPNILMLNMSFVLHEPKQLSS